MSLENATPLAIYTADEWSLRPASQIDADFVEQVHRIVQRVEQGGRAAVEEFAKQWDGWDGVSSLLLGRAELVAAIERVSDEVRQLLERVHGRIQRFALAQRGTIGELELAIPGGAAGHRLLPIEQVGCYVPGGRYPLPSTALMTVTTARAAGCRRVVMATPKPDPVILAAAAIAGADEVLLVGGAQAVAALAIGFEGFDAVDLICGPGNRWVTAAKQWVVGRVGIDMLAGPSELVVVADDRADCRRVAFDLLAQAEHDRDARPFLVTSSRAVAVEVNRHLQSLISESPHRETICLSCVNGAAIVARDWEEVVRVVDRLAPEHLELHIENAVELASRFRNAGCVFIGGESAEVFGDYGIGPNHTLPTGGSSRYSSGLNVMTFMCWQTWLRLEQPIPPELIQDTMALADLEGLTHHRLAAQQRL